MSPTTTYYGTFRGVSKKLEEYYQAYAALLYDINHMPRHSGRTTRLVDAYVQELFERGEVNVRDHYPEVTNHLRVFKILLERLKREHHMYQGVHYNLCHLKITLR